MSKALKCANNDDTCMIKHDDNEGDSVTFTFCDTKRDKTQVRLKGFHREEKVIVVPFRM